MLHGLWLEGLQFHWSIFVHYLSSNLKSSEGITLITHTNWKPYPKHWNNTMAIHNSWFKVYTWISLCKVGNKHTSNTQMLLSFHDHKAMHVSVYCVVYETVLNCQCEICRLLMTSIKSKDKNQNSVQHLDQSRDLDTLDIKPRDDRIWGGGLKGGRRGSGVERWRLIFQNKTTVDLADTAQRHKINGHTEIQNR